MSEDGACCFRAFILGYSIFWILSHRWPFNVLIEGPRYSRTAVASLGPTATYTVTVIFIATLIGNWQVSNFIYGPMRWELKTAISGFVNYFD